MYLHMDSETTGLVVNGVPSNDPRQPHAASISAFMDVKADKIEAEMCRLIKPNGYRLEDFPEAFRVHGITTERAHDEGVTLLQAMEEFVAIAEQCKTISAFNLFFDFKIIKVACARLGDAGEPMRAKLEALTGICTMESAAAHLNGKKRISLKNAYWELFKNETQQEQFHGSRLDALASRRIFWELDRRKALLPPKPMLRTYETPYNPAAAPEKLTPRRKPVQQEIEL